MDTENVVHLLNVVLLSRVGGGSNDILKFASKWTEVEETILSEVTQTQKEKHGMYSCISGF